MRHSTRFDVHHWIPIALVFFAFATSALISRHVFERLPHLEDEVAYLYQARIFARGEAVIDTPEPRRAYWQPFVVDYEGKRFGKYSPGWPALLGIGVAFGQAWVINAFAAALTVALTYRLGREVFSPDAGVIAAALVAFSPMALLLNASLMGHTSALTAFMAFAYAYWRLTRGKRAVWWGIAAGVALGLLVINRPLTTIGVVTPFIIWSGLRVLAAGWRTVRSSPDGGGEGARPYGLRATLSPLLALAVVASVMALALPAFNRAATGEPGKNLYTLVWEYDRVGFGICCGRSSVRGDMQGHNVVKGIRHMRYDLSLTAADLFGWQSGFYDGSLWDDGIVDEALTDHFRNDPGNYFPLTGLSWLLIPFGLLVGFRRLWLGAWALAGIALFIGPMWLDADLLTAAITPALDAPELWVILMLAWMLIPPLALAFRRESDERSTWTWLLLAVAVGLVGVHLAYWIGSQRYSTRYYFEMLAALALISALPLAWVAQRVSRAAFYGAFFAFMLFTLVTYSLPRIDALYRYNFITPEQAARVESLRDSPETPALVIVQDGTPGDSDGVRWRSFGSLMVETSPFLDSDVVVAWDYSTDGSTREMILERFPDREVIDLYADGNLWWFEGDPVPPEALLD